MNYYIGIDSGGTKTDAVICNEEGRVIVHIKESGCNPNDIGKDTAREKLLYIVNTLIMKSPARVVSVFAGVAGMLGFGDNFSDYIKEKTGIAYVRVETDALPLITSVLFRSDGACVISGTGSACFVRRNGKLTRIGGWGFMLDGGGSGYDLGRDAIAATLHDYDGQGEKTAISDILTARMGTHPKDVIPDIYRGGRAYIASFADTVFLGCRNGDKVSIEIMQRNAEYIAGLIKTAGRHFEDEFTVALGGGILQNYPEFRSAIRILVPERINLVTADMPQAYGAVIEAIYASGSELPLDFKKNFCESYKLADIIKAF